MGADGRLNIIKKYNRIENTIRYYSKNVPNINFHLQTKYPC
jgi:hypothetical protein